MNNTIKLALLGMVFTSAASFADDCTQPNAPTLPDGASATLEQMLVGQQAVKEYQAANSAYRECMDPKIAAAETAAAGDSPGPELVEALKVLTDSFNESVSKEEELAAQFNTELREYKEANPS
jgi:hypothetical protein